MSSVNNCRPRTHHHWRPIGEDRRVSDTVSRRSLVVVVAASLVAPHTVVVPLMAAWATLVWWRHRIHTPTVAPRGTAFTLAMVLMVVAALASMTVLPVNVAGLRLLAWFVLGAGMAGAVRRLPSGRLAAVSLGTGAAWGAVFAGAAALIEVGLMGARRADSFSGNAIVFGNMALTLGVVAWWLAPNRRLAMMAVVGALMASVLSGSRGGWLAVPLVLLLAVADHRRRGGVVPWKRLVGVAVPVIAAVVMSGGGMPMERLAAAVDDVTEYVGAEAPAPATGTSIGARFEAWRAAGSAFMDQPLTGVGWGNLGEEFEEQVAAGQRHPRIATFSHAHHHLLGALASGGMVGFAAAVLVLAVPAWWFRRAWRSSSPTARSLGALGTAVVGGYVVFGFSEAIFDDGIAIALYALVVGVTMRRLDELSQRGEIDTPAPTVPASPQ